jgi:hypothetical protein
LIKNTPQSMKIRLTPSVGTAINPIAKTIITPAKTRGQDRLTTIRELEHSGQCDGGLSLGTVESWVRALVRQSRNG